MPAQEKKEIFNKKQMIDNIMHLLKLRNKRIGELEEYAGLSKGYIARSKNSADTKPGIEYVMRMAEYLEVSIDTLLNSDLKELSAADLYWQEFLKRLTDATQRDKVTWMIAGNNIYNLKMENGNILQLRQRNVVVQRPAKATIEVVEFYLQKPKTSPTILCTNDERKGPLTDVLDKLFYEVSRNAKRPKVDVATRKMLEEFLGALEVTK